MNVINFNAVVQSSRSHMMYTTKVIVEQRAPANRKYIFPYTCNTTLIDKVECIYSMYYSVTVNKVRNGRIWGCGRE